MCATVTGRGRNDFLIYFVKCLYMLYCFLGKLLLSLISLRKIKSKVKVISWRVTSPFALTSFR